MQLPKLGVTLHAFISKTVSHTKEVADEEQVCRRVFHMSRRFPVKFHPSRFWFAGVFAKNDFV